LLFADIAGFVPIAARISALGPEGVERLSEVLNDYLGRLIQVVHDHGGDVVSFHGDALLAQWPADASDGLARSTRAAARCALEMQAALGDYCAAEDTRFSLKVALCAGEILAFHAGGTNGRWVFFLAGPALTALFATLAQARVGAVVVDASVRELLGPHARLTNLGDRFATLLELDLSTAPRPLSALSKIDPLAFERVASYVPPVVRARMAAQQDAWLADLRRVSILFANVRDLDLASDDAASSVQALVQVVQDSLAALEGTFQQIVVDDKGAVIVAAFGLPPFAHEDDGVRAARAALTIGERLSGLGLDYSIGVTRGRTLCGPVGRDSRREYAMIGDAVNLSARLMSAAGARGILCDAASMRDAGAGTLFEALPDIFVKGRAEAVAVHRPVASQHRTARAHGRERKLVGRSVQRRTLQEHLEGVRAGRGAAVVIEGEAGLGKSRLLEALRDDARSRGVSVWLVEADAVEHRTPYFAFRALIARALQDDPQASVEQRTRAALARLESDPKLQRLAPLLDAVLPFDLPDNEITRQMVGEVRADNTRELLAGVIQCAARGPTLLMLEDLHWLDSASMSLVNELRRRLPDLLVVAGTRPPATTGDLTDTLSSLLDAEGFERIVLEPLSASETDELVREQLGVSELPRGLAERIHAKAGGNPFFSEELVLALRESGAIAVAAGHCRWHEQADAPLPDTLQEVVTARIDRLGASEQLTVKVASVIGRSFAYPLLRETHPLGDSGEELRRDADSLVRVDLTRLLREDPDDEWIFKHVVTQEAAYALLPFAQRRKLHERVARYIEQRYAENLAPVLPLLAHHWGAANDATRAVDYLERAGEQALHGGSYREAIRFLTQAVELADAGATEVEALRRVRWQRHLGDGYLRTGNPERSRGYLERALRDLGRPAPEGRAAVLGEILLELGRQLLHRAFPRHFVGTVRDRARTTEEAFAAEHLGHVCFFTDVMGQGVAVILRSLNLAERLGPSAQLARAYALTGTSAGIQGAHGVARYYGGLARRVLESVESASDRALVHVYFALEELSVGHWSEARRLAEEGIAMAERIGDARRWGDHHVQLVMVGRPSGDLTLVRDALTKLRESGLLEGDPLLRCWTYCQCSEDAALRGDLDAAESFLALAAEPLSELGLSEKIWVLGNLAHVCWRRGERDRALAVAHEGLDTMRRIPPMRLGAFEGYAGVVETFLGVMQGAASRDEAREHERSLRSALRQLATFSRGFVVGRPRTHLMRGRYEAARGRRVRALARFRRALTLAQELAMPLEEALARLALGFALAVSDPGRQVQLRAAAEGFDRLGATPYATLARAGCGEAKP
jgi:class 3 adenylate cyclase/tetratricopeptide (TPR) repeat protein